MAARILRSAGGRCVTVSLTALLLVAVCSLGSSASVEKAEGATLNSAKKAPPLGKAMRDRIGTAISGSLAQTGAPGAVFGISVPGRRTYVTARGVADTATGRRMTTRLAAPIGSITKTFTVTVLLQLADEGKIDLDATIGHWFPNIPRSNQITLRMLANMTSGIADFVEEIDRKVCAHPRRHWRPQQLIHMGTTLPRAFKKPGTEMSYSTTNTVILGRVIERVTGVSYERNLRNRVIKPLGLRRTGLKTGPTVPKPFAHGYTKYCGDQYRDSSRWSVSWAWAGGALYSTARDLLDWGRAVGTGRTLSRRAFADRLTSLSPPVAPGVRGWYGLGINLSANEPDRPVLFHSGQVYGNEAIFQFYPASGVTVAILVNGDGGPNPTGITEQPLLSALTAVKPVVRRLVNG